ncbi:Hypothetical_protein [Hexamita inflata]|uniref:Hypothetical_protein n=1 Tax=Hexamita inflata TaxID=28002 RepID=A0AA86QEB5_9EUKA|nr:Hypothetical protein HINF_LOCUS45349 [Hexamita inflata]
MIIHQDIYLVAQIASQLLSIVAISVCFYFYAKLERVKQMSIHIAAYMYYCVLIGDAILTIILYSVQYGTRQLIQHIDAQIFLQNQLMPMMSVSLICSLQVGVIVPSASKSLIRSVIIIISVILLLSVSAVFYLLFSRENIPFTSNYQCFDLMNNTVTWNVVTAVSYGSAFVLFLFLFFLLKKNKNEIKMVNSKTVLYKQINYQLIYFSIQQVSFLAFYFVSRHVHCDLAVNIMCEAFHVFFEVNRGILFVYPQKLRIQRLQETKGILESSEEEA